MNALMKMNPELVRNARMELSTQRLIIAPVIIALILVLILFSAGSEKANSILHYGSYGAFIFVTMLWGLKSASDAVIDEYNERTWDWQKMSIIGSTKLALGKLFGSTIYQWFIGAIFILIYILTSFNTANPLHEIVNAVNIILIAIAAQCTIIMFSLLNMQRADGKGRLHSTRIFIIGLLIIWAFSSLIRDGLLNNIKSENIQWFGITNFYVITLTSTLFYCGWALTGLIRGMRAELQFADKPICWAAFLFSNTLFTYGYCAGNPQLTFWSGLTVALALNFIGLLFFSYLIALTEKKDLVNFRIVTDNFKARNWDSFWRNIPLWPLTFAIAFFIGLLAVIFSGIALHSDFFTFNLLALKYAEVMSKVHFGSIVAIYIAVFGFVLRDIGIMLLLNFAGRSRRSDGAMIVYLLVLYVLLPLLIKSGFRNSTEIYDFLKLFFLPVTDGNFTILTAIIPLAEATLVFYFLRNKWKEINISFNK